MTVDDAYVCILHCMTRWDGRAGDEHDGRFLAAVGDRNGAQDPPWVHVNETYFHWEQQFLPKNTGKDSAMGAFFSRRENRGMLFDASGKEKNDAATWVPRYPLLPMKVAAKVAKKPPTP